MFSKKFQFCAVLSFAVLSGFPAAYGGDENPDAEICQYSFIGGGESPTVAARPLRVKIVQRLTVPETRWVSWFGGGRKGLYLGMIDAANTVRVFEPAKGPKAIYSAHWFSLGGGNHVDSRAGWVEWNGLASIQVGDEQGRQRVLFEPFGHPNPSAQALDAQGPVELHNLPVQDGRWVTAYAQSELNRIRIVPVGKLQDAYEIPVTENILWLAEHRTPRGEALLAVATKSELAIYKLNDGAQTMFKTRISLNSIQPSWLINKRGESLLIVATAEGRIRVLFPESEIPGLDSDAIFPNLSSLQAIRVHDGVIVLAKSRGEANTATLLKMSAGNYGVIGDISADLVGQRELSLIHGPFEKALLMSTRNVDGQRVLAIMDAENVESVLATASFDHVGESVRGIHQVRLDNERVQVAVATDRRVYVLEIY